MYVPCGTLSVTRLRIRNAMLQRRSATSTARPVLVRYGPPLVTAPERAEVEPTTANAGAADAGEGPAALSHRLRLALRTPSGQALAIWGASRVLLVAYTLIAGWLTLRQQPGGFSPSGLLQLWQRSDTNWYLHIAQSGYSWTGDVAFFPLFPLLIAGAEHLFGATHALLLALLLSNLAALIGCVGLAQLAADELGTVRQSRLTVLAIAATPLAFFLGAAYTESLFFACAVWGLWAMRRGYWYRAAGCALLAVLCRSTGIILVAPLLYEFVRQNAPTMQLLTRERAAQAVAVLSATPVGIGLFSAYCLEHTGDPLAWLHIEGTFWRHSTAPIWQGVQFVAAHFLSLPAFSREQGREVLVDLLPLLVVTLLTMVLARRQPVAFTLYLVGLLYLTLASPIVVDAARHYDIFDSAGRYMLPAIPVYLAVARGAARLPRPFAVLGSAALGLQAVLAV